MSRLIGCSGTPLNIELVLYTGLKIRIILCNRYIVAKKTSAYLANILLDSCFIEIYNARGINIKKYIHRIRFNGFFSLISPYIILINMPIAKRKIMLYNNLNFGATVPTIKNIGPKKITLNILGINLIIFSFFI